ncbi:MAG: class I SAM-dependent methyltransferase [Nanoarchaeota archaeon]
MSKEIRITKEIYTRNTEREWRRLVRDPFHQLEFDTTMRFLKKYLPNGGLILDAGGGPGRYSIELAKLGYSVVLLDLVPANLELAKEKIREAKVQNKIEEIIEGSIADLSRFESATFDAVLCLGGPLSHVNPESKRKKALNELVRVAKKKAPIFVSVMGKYGSIMSSPSRSVNEIRMDKHFKEWAFDGDDYMWGSASMGEHGYSHYFELDELKGILPKNCSFVENVGLEGLSSANQIAINELAKDRKAWKNWMKLHYAVCTKPSIVDTSMHFMVIARKK